MITSIGLVDFKNFANERLRIGPLTVIVGTNASGKSNIRDAFRFLHGIGRGYTLAEIIGGKYGAGGQTEWAAIRGAPNEISRLQQDQGYYGFLVMVTIRRGWQRIEYSIGIRSDVKNFGGFRVFQEELREGNKTIYTSHPKVPDPVRDQGDETHLLLRMGKVGEQRKYGHRIAVRPNQPALTQIEEHKQIRRMHKESAKYVIETLAHIRFLDLVPNRMRQPAFPGQTVLGDGGENLPTVLREICADSKRKASLVRWTQELTPMDVKDLEFPIDELTGLVQLVICEDKNRKLSAYSMSDGTLRFLAMLAALMARNLTGLYFFEEIDNGIHPSRLHLLLQLIEGQTAKRDVQVISTTHSPNLLSMISDTTFESTSIVWRLPATGEAVIRPVAELPRGSELRNAQGLGRLHAAGWMEDALEFGIEE